MEQPNMVVYVEIDPSRRYGRFGEVLGKGAMKTVYRAFDEVLGMEVAWNRVKLNDVFWSPDDIKRLYTEVHLLKNLKHESIIRFYTSWIDNDQKTFNFITEMFSSGTLRNYRQKYKRVDMQAIKNWARQVLHGLVYLHSHDPPVIHRDLKCDNIFVNGHLGQVKIGDLGLAAVLHGSQHAHSVIGTPEFMAPELYEEEYNELVDVYSFGMCVLEMLSSEYPYSECSNPAQIYKKVTSGKKPNAFYRIQDFTAQQFVGKCLEVAAKRLPAYQLLQDPFLASDEALLVATGPALQIYSPKGKREENPLLLDDPVRSTDMTVTGEVNPEGNAISLKVRIVDLDGHVQNVHFSFDILYDKAMDVALEMVNELDITDWEPFEIAAMIEKEISDLVPTWRDYHVSSSCIRQHSFTYDEEEEANNDDNNNNEDCKNDPFSHSIQPCNSAASDWFHDDMSSQGSYGSFNYSNTSYSCVSEEIGESSSTLKSLGSTTRACPEGNTEPKHERRKDGGLVVGRGRMQTAKPNAETKMSKLRSFMDIRSQLLHKALKQAMQKTRSFKTVGSVEGIGFQTPDDISDNNVPRRGAAS